MLITVIRHARTTWNEQGRMQGRRDVPLSAAGRDEVRRWRLPDGAGGELDWVASPLMRAVETAVALGGGLPRIEPALIEMDWGQWEGQRLAELRQRDPVAFSSNERRGLDFRPPGGESPRDVMTRVIRWLDAIAAVDRPVVAVTHKGVLRALLAIATGWDMRNKPPVKLRPATLQRFVLARSGMLRIDMCNVPLAGAFSEGSTEPLPPAPSTALP